MAEFAIPKVYNQETGEWIELYANPIVEKVIEAMKNDWLANKDTIDYWLLEEKEGVPEPIRLVVFTDGNPIDEYTKDNFEWAFHDFIAAMPNKKLFSIDDFLKDCRDRLIKIPKQFEISVNTEVIDEEYGNTVIHSPSLNSITNDVDITSILTKEVKGNLTVEYVYNDHPIDDKRFVHLAENEIYDNTSELENTFESESISESVSESQSESTSTSESVSSTFTNESQNI